jgi:hypothetical protein
MENAILITGKDDKGKENYQLLLGKDYYTIKYDGSIERSQFYQQAAEEFARLIFKSKKEITLGITNGNRIVHETGKYEKISKLEERLAQQFADAVCAKIESLPLISLPACIVN